jgi:hypothetical protein
MKQISLNIYIYSLFVTQAIFSIIFSEGIEKLEYLKVIWHCFRRVAVHAKMWG